MCLDRSNQCLHQGQLQLIIHVCNFSPVTWVCTVQICKNGHQKENMVVTKNITVNTLDGLFEDWIALSTR